jgi:hypothetical protein
MSSIYTAKIEENIVNRKNGEATVTLSKIKNSLGIVIKDKARYDYSKNSNILGNYKKGDTIEFMCKFTDGEIDFIAEAKIIGISSHFNSFSTAIIKDPHRRKYLTRLDNGKLVAIKKSDKRLVASAII